MSFAAQRRRASKLREWHRETRTALDERELAILSLISRQLPVPQAVLGMTEQEVADYFEDARSELDAAVSLLALAEAEAVLRTDFLARVQKKSKDPVGRRFRQLHRNKGQGIRLEDELLGAWVEHHGACRAAVADFRAALKLRHWLAHGRYWRPKFGRPYVTQDVFLIADQLFAKLPGVDGWI